MKKGIDLRVVKTRRALISAMLTLLTKTPFSKITVNDLCAQALVSRSAFYAHFQDKYDLAVHCLSLLGEQLFAKEQGQSLEKRLYSLLERISRDSRVFHNLLMADYDGELVALLRRGFLEDFEQRSRKREDCIVFPYPEDVSVLFCASGMTSAIMHWISNDMQYSVEEMTACLCALLPE